jgi:hypothetical protein
MYAQLDSPLPGLTVSPSGERCCGMRGSHMSGGMRGLGDLTFDTTSTDSGGDLIDPSTGLTPGDVFSPVDLSTLTPNVISPSLDSMYPPTVGTEFTSNGDGSYTNIQTGQRVPYDTAAAVTQATIGPATVNLSTTPTESNLTLTDPTTGATSTISTNNLTAAAQALQAAGQLVTAAGKLTAQGQALLNSGNLYGTLPSTGISGAMSSLTSWFTGSTLIAGVPNVAILGIGVLAAMFIPSMLSSGPKRRKR